MADQDQLDIGSLSGRPESTCSVRFELRVIPEADEKTGKLAAAGRVRVNHDRTRQRLRRQEPGQRRHDTAGSGKRHQGRQLHNCPGRRELKPASRTVKCVNQRMGPSPRSEGSLVDHIAQCRSTHGSKIGLAVGNRGLQRVDQKRRPCCRCGFEFRVILGIEFGEAGSLNGFLQVQAKLDNPP